MSMKRRHAFGMAEPELTERERIAATLLAYGHTNGDVARELHVSLRTAEGERSRLMRKLGFERRSQLVHWAIDHGLLR
jgi:two-component system, NarL family, response regulator NreC